MWKLRKFALKLFWQKKFVKVKFLQKKLLKSWFHEKAFGESEFLALPHCAILKGLLRFAMLIEPICGCKIDEEICTSASQCICHKSQKMRFFYEIDMPTKGNWEDFAKLRIDDNFEPLVYNTRRY